MKFLVGYQMRETSGFVEEIVRQREHIREVYFSWGNYANGRNSQLQQVELTPWEAQAQQERDLKAISEAGIPLNVLFNAMCYGNDEAKAHSQTLIFRLLPHSTRARDDVPDWLKTMIPCPERPDGERLKDSPTDPLFIELFCEAVRKLGERFDSDPVFDAIDISLPGAWGEGHELERYPEEDILRIFDTYIEAFPNTQLMGQCHRTDFLYYTRQRANIGWRGDGLGNPPHTHEKYPTYIPKIADFWKTAPVSFESYWWLGEWKRKGWDIDEIIEKTLEWHITSFNPKSIPIPYEWQEKVEYWLSKMGYHYAIDSFTAPKSTCKGEELRCALCVDNIGVAPSYHTIGLFCRLKTNKTSSCLKPR